MLNLRITIEGRGFDNGHYVISRQLHTFEYNSETICKQSCTVLHTLSNYLIVTGTIIPELHSNVCACMCVCTCVHACAIIYTKF